MRSLVSSVFMGWAVTAVLPGRLGEMARPMLLGRREGLGKMAVFGTVALERVLDTLLVLLLLAIYLTFFPLAFSQGDDTTTINTALRTGGWLLLAGLAGAASVVIVAVRLRPSTRDRVRAVIDTLPAGCGRPSRLEPNAVIRDRNIRAAGRRCSRPLPPSALDAGCHSHARPVGLVCAGSTCCCFERSNSIFRRTPSFL